MWPFGFGLSYTDFSIHWPASPPPLRTLTSVTEEVAYSVSVSNIGGVAGDEVLQAYFIPSGSIPTRRDAPTPMRQLFGFERLHLAGGETKTVTFNVSATELALIDAEGNRDVHSDPNYQIVFSRGHGAELSAPLAIALNGPVGGVVRLETFERWW